MRRYTGRQARAALSARVWCIVFGRRTLLIIVLRHFLGGADGGSPLGTAFVQANDGRLYGLAVNPRLILYSLQRMEVIIAFSSRFLREQNRAAFPPMLVRLPQDRMGCSTGSTSRAGRMGLHRKARFFVCRATGTDFRSWEMSLVLPRRFRLVRRGNFSA